jgi:hypothetical protein
MNENSKGRQFYLSVAALLGWFAVILQFYLILLNREASVPETILRYFSFFTILSNILMALCFSSLLLFPRSAWGSFFSRPATLTAITVYMCMVGIIYNLILRSLWDPQGLQRTADDLLHTIDPLFSLGFWVFYVSKARLKWKHAFLWMLYPVVFFFFLIVRGLF